MNDYAEIIEREEQRNQARNLLSNPSQWRRNNVKLNVFGLRLNDPPKMAIMVYRSTKLNPEGRGSTIYDFWEIL